jgi:signal transduction histidine kinase/ActR/RegA family two-component response regulator/uncharacterized protein YigA (DUF484 family)
MSPEPISRRGAIPGLAYSVAVVLPAAAVWAELLLSRFVGSNFLFFATGGTIAVAAWYGGFWPGAVATVVGPGVLFQFGSTGEAWALAAFVAGWMAVCALLHTDTSRRLADRAARVGAQAAAAQSERVAQLTAALGRARSVTAVVEAAVQEALHALRGDAAMLILVSDDGAPGTVPRAVGYDSPVAEGISLTAAGPVRDAVRRRAPVAVESREAWTAEYGHDSPDVGTTFAASATVPLIVGHPVAAVVRIDFRERRTFTDADLEFLALMSAHGSHALERAREQASDQRARIEAEGLRERADEELARRQTIEQALRASETRYRALASRTTRLHALTAALSESVTTDAVARAIVQQATVVVGATAADVVMLADERTSPDAIDAAPGLRRLVPEPGLCETEVLTTRRPVFIKSWDESQERYWRSASAAADAAYSSSAALPLLVAGSVAGVLRFDFSVPVNFDDEYQALLVSVAQHCSQALDRARLYETAQRARADAETASRLKDDFLSIVSHELRTPLNSVLGWASMLRKSAPDSALAQRAVQSIHDNATRQAQLIDDLLDVSRIAAGRATLDCQEVDVAALVGGVVESLIPVAASSDVELRQTPMAPAFVMGDRRRLEQVFFNVLGNALKFTPAGGAITIEAQTSDTAVEVRIKDNGVGIAPEFLPYVFDRFRQADSTSTRSYGGLGLGLSIAKQLVDAHKGTIAVASEGQGRGTAFAVRLPLTETRQPRDRRADAPVRRPATEAPRLDGTRVLVVDDETDARDVMALALSHHGAEVTTASTAPEAYELLVSRTFDVLLADIAMPGEDGCSLIRRVRACPHAHVSQIPAAAVTAHARDEERRSVLDAGFHVHLVKPIEPIDLVRAVGELRGGAGVALSST